MSGLAPPCVSDGKNENGEDGDMHKEINGSHMHKVSKSYHNEDSYHLT